MGRAGGGGEGWGGGGGRLDEGVGEGAAEKVYLGNFSSLPLCASACSSKPGCRFFIYGTGRKAGTCFQELTPDASCINKQRLLA